MGRSQPSTEPHPWQLLVALTGCVVSPDNQVPRPSVPGPCVWQEGRFWGAATARGAAPSVGMPPPPPFPACHLHPETNPEHPTDPWQGAPRLARSLASREKGTCTHRATQTPRHLRSLPAASQLPATPAGVWQEGGGTAPKNPPAGLFPRPWGGGCVLQAGMLPAAWHGCCLLNCAESTTDGRMASRCSFATFWCCRAPSLAFLQNNSKEGGWEEPCVHWGGGEVPQ